MGGSLRFLHTSDWHLGQTLHGFDRAYEHLCFLNWLLEALVDEQVDVLLVSGDVFDNANPSAAAQRLLYQFLQGARARLPHLNMVFIAGNHDSPGRLEAPAPLLELFGTVVVGQVGRGPGGEIDVEKLVVPLRDRSGAVRALCVAVPFLRPGDVPRVESEGDAYPAGVAALYREAQALAFARREPGQAVLAMGHCHLSGGGVSADSERRIVIGGAEMLPAGIFDERLAYVALGHLHLPQAAGGVEWIRYSGSPLPLSFSELHYPHQVVCVDVDGEDAGMLRAIRVPRFVKLLRVPAYPAVLPRVLDALESLKLDDLPEEQWPYLEARVLFEGPEPGARVAVESALAGKPLRLARIDASHARPGTDPGAETVAAYDDLDRLQPEDIFLKHYGSLYGEVVPDDLRQAFQELLLVSSMEDDI